jgi:hypothetical protein
MEKTNENKPAVRAIIKTISDETETKLKNTVLTKTDDVGVVLEKIMSEGADTFKDKTGRNMTYWEMRRAFG